MRCLRSHVRHAYAAVCGEQCGSGLEAERPIFGEANPLGAKFYKKGGRPPTQPGAAGPGSRPEVRPPKTYTPKHLAEKPLTSKTALKGESQQMTVLFADLKGLMKYKAVAVTGEVWAAGLLNMFKSREKTKWPPANTIIGF